MICKCGHNKKDHTLERYKKGFFSFRCKLCQIKYKNTFGTPEEIWLCWHDFEVSNLRYLEQKYEESVK